MAQQDEEIGDSKIWHTIKLNESSYHSLLTYQSALRLKYNRKISFSEAVIELLKTAPQFDIKVNERPTKEQKW